MGWTKEKPVPPLPPIPKNMGYNVNYDQLSDFIKGEEGFRKEAYRIPTYHNDGTISWGNPTIGYGAETYQDGSSVQMGDTIDEFGATELWKHHINTGIEQLEKIPAFQKMNTNQKTAIVSFGYNLGPYFMSEEANQNGEFDTIQTAIKSGDADQIAAAMRLYNRKGPVGRTVYSPGLAKRRENEIELYNMPMGDDDIEGRYE
tara:strand:- start:144 stop:749 length:606 start_codon:yes stop_codon:yes gene_type:complete